MEQLSLFPDERRPDMTFSELAELFFAHYAEENLKTSTRTNYQYITERFLLPRFGDLPLSEFNNLMLTRWFRELPVSPSYCKNIFTVLRSMFTLAMHNGFITQHPCDYVILPRKKALPEEGRPKLTKDNVQELLRLTEEFSWFTSVVKFLLLTGVRSGEAFALHWEDVDLEQGFFTIRRNLANVKSKHWVDTPKTKNSIRQIAMCPQTKKLLRRQKHEQEIWILHADGVENFPHPEIVFTTPEGNYIDHNYAARKFKQMIKGTEFEDITLHSLRHAHATFMLAAGVDLKVVSALLGHSSISTTANLYTEVLEQTKIDAALKFGEWLEE